MAKKLADRVTRVMEFIDEERSKDTDKEADIDFMNAVLERLEGRIQAVEDELDEGDLAEGEEEEMGDDDTEDMPEEEEEGV